MADPVPGTLAYLKARIGREIARPALTQQIADAITDAIAAYQNERFRFSDIDPSVPPTFNTVPGRYIYTSADNANIGSALRIDYVNANIGTASVIDLVRTQPNRIKLYNLPNQQLMGQPAWYAYEGNQLLIAPIPNDAFLITLGLFRAVAAPADDEEEDNPWMTDAELLIRSRAKYEIATHVTRNPVMAAAMSPDAPVGGAPAGAAYRAFRSLKNEANRITGTGKIRSMQF